MGGVPVSSPTRALMSRLGEDPVNNTHPTRCPHYPARSRTPHRRGFFYKVTGGPKPELQACGQWRDHGPGLALRLSSFPDAE